jgi:serine/threonine protein kinase
MQLSQGTLLFNGKYKTESVLGQGGFGITYLAVHIALDKQVVIKEFFMKTQSKRNEDNSVSAPNLGAVEYEKFKQKFLDEARLLAKFEENPYIVDVTDHFEENNTAYFVMPYIKGMSLTEFASKQANGILTEVDGIKVMRQLALALAEMHQKGVLHRDIKPDNLLVSDKGGLMLIDFGSAREYITQEFGERNSIMLTPGYAPPEQYDANAQKGTYTDIYAVGALLYRLLTGKLPLDAEKRKTEKLIPPIELNANISPYVNAQILRAMEMTPEFRFQSITGFINALLEKPVENKPKVEPKIEPKIEPKEEIQPPIPKIEEKKEVVVPPPPPKKEEKAIENPILQKADDLFNQKKYTLALAFYEDAAKTQPNNPFIQKQINLCKQAIQPIKVENQNTEKKSIVTSFSNMNWKYVALFAAIVGIIGVGIKMGLMSEHTKLVEPDMVRVSGGVFWMGNKDKRAEEDEKPNHAVALGSFYLGRTEVTNAEWRMYCKKGGGKLLVDMPKSGMDNYPVINVSKREAEAYCRWLTSKFKKTYRLPTEAEWEYAASGGKEKTNVLFSGNMISSKVAWCCGSSLHPVKKKDPNELGIYDMTGNVWEWCADSYSASYYKECERATKKGGTLKDPICKKGGDWGVLRGGDHKTSEMESHIYNRTAAKMDRYSAQYVTGFRVVREI